MTSSRASLSWLAHTARGVCMGVADIIPGVSGGTMALILGIYERFIAAVSAVGWGMLRAALTGAFWKRLARGLRAPDELDAEDPTDAYAGHVLFLIFLLAGIAAAFMVGARFIPYLLDRYPAQMLGFFFGLVLASVPIPFRRMSRRTPVHLLVLLVFGAATFVLVGLPIDRSSNAEGTVVLELRAPPLPDETVISPQALVFMTERHGGEDEKREVAFGPETEVRLAPGQTRVEVPIRARLAGEVGNLPAGALTVMHGAPEGTRFQQPAATTGGRDPSLLYVFLAGILAISAMVLPGVSGSFILLMLGLYHYMTFMLRAVVYDQDLEAGKVVALFLAAIAVGIMGFSRFLNWLLARYHDATMAALMGIMLGSLRKIWPFSETLPDGSLSASFPTAFDTTTLTTLVAFGVGATAVLLLERTGRVQSP